MPKGIAVCNVLQNRATTISVVFVKNIIFPMTSMSSNHIKYHIIIYGYLICRRISGDYT